MRGASAYHGRRARIHGKPVEDRRCPRNGKRAHASRARRPGPALSSTPQLAGTLAARSQRTVMKPSSLAGLIGLAALGAQAQVPQYPFAFAPQPFEPLLVTASRTLAATPTLRDAIVITREELE